MFREAKNGFKTKFDVDIKIIIIRVQITQAYLLELCNVNFLIWVSFSVNVRKSEQRNTMVTLALSLEIQSHTYTK